MITIAYPPPPPPQFPGARPSETPVIGAARLTRTGAAQDTNVLTQPGAFYFPGYVINPRAPSPGQRPGLQTPDTFTSALLGIFHPTLTLVRKTTSRSDAMACGRPQGAPLTGITRTVVRLPVPAREIAIHSETPGYRNRTHVQPFYLIFQLSTMRRSHHAIH